MKALDFVYCDCPNVECVSAEVRRRLDRIRDPQLIFDLNDAWSRFVNIVEAVGLNPVIHFELADHEVH